MCLNVEFVMMIGKTNSIIWNVLSPEPVILPYSVHFLNGDILRLRHEKVDESCHYHDPSPEEEEEPKFHAAKHGEEKLADDECEKHVN